MCYATPHFIVAIPLLFFRVGLFSRGFLTFSGDVASHGVSDVIVTMEMPRSRGLASTDRHQMHMRKWKLSIALSENQTLEMRSRFRRSWAMHGCIMMVRSKSDEQKSGRTWTRAVGSCSSYAHNTGHPSDLHELERSTLFAQNSL